MTVTELKQYSVFMPNKPGALSALTERFGDAGVNILGIASEVREDSALVRVAVEHEMECSSVLSKAGYASVEGRLLSLELDDAPGSFGDVTKKLSDGGVNITTVYGSSAGGSTTRILISVEDTDKALKLLKVD
jgi:hypothetical protein